MSERVDFICPDGTRYLSTDPAKIPCLEMCDDGTWGVRGEFECLPPSPPVAETVPSTDVVRPTPAPPSTDFSNMWAVGLSLVTTVVITRLLKPNRGAARSFVRELGIVFVWVIGLGLAGSFAVSDCSQQSSARRVAQPAATAAPSGPNLETLCTPTRLNAVGEIIGRTDGRDVFVKPLFWNALPFDARENFAAIAAHCVVGGSASITIRHGNTGRELATYSSVWGYDGKE